MLSRSTLGSGKGKWEMFRVKPESLTIETDWDFRWLDAQESGGYVSLRWSGL